jgi:hypothetical protein
MGTTCSSHLIHFYISIQISSSEESSLRPLSRKFLHFSVSSCHVCPAFPRRYPLLKHLQFVLFPQALDFPYLNEDSSCYLGIGFPEFKPFYLLALLDWSTVSMEICTRHLLTKHWESCLWSKLRERDRLNLLTSQHRCISQASKSTIKNLSEYLRTICQLFTEGRR